VHPSAEGLRIHAQVFNGHHSGTGNFSGGWVVMCGLPSGYRALGQARVVRGGKGFIS
jgi:hypothetical protein